MLKQVAATTPFLPAAKPRYTMGLGTPPQILKMIALGVDMFDCVHPTRVARNGAAFTRKSPPLTGSPSTAITRLPLAARATANSPTPEYRSTQVSPALSANTRLSSPPTRNRLP